MRRVFVDVQTKILIQTGIVGVDVGSTEKFFFLWEVLMKIISTDTFFFYLTWDSFCLLYGVVIFLQMYWQNFYFYFYFFKWDGFCFFYWRGSYFLQTWVVGSSFLEEKIGEDLLYTFFFFLTTRGEFFMLLNRSRSLLTYYVNPIFKT